MLLLFLSLFQWGTVPKEDRNLGIFFRHPPEWKIVEKEGGLRVEIPGGAYIELTTESEIRSLQVEVTDSTVEKDRQLWEGKGYEVASAKTLRIDGQYVKTFTVEKEQEFIRFWVTLLPETLRIYRIAYYSAPGAGRKNSEYIQQWLQTWRFLGTRKVFWTTPFFTITGRNYDVFFLVLLSLFCLIFLGKGFWIDVYRLVRMPGDVFRDLSLSESFIYPIFLVLFSTFLYTAAVSQQKDYFLAQWDETVREKSRLLTTTKVEALTTDPTMRGVLMSDVHHRAMLIPEQIITSLPYLLPLISLFLWVVWGLAGFLAMKVFRGLTTFPQVWKSIAGLYFPLALSQIIFLWYITKGGWWLLLLSLLIGAGLLYVMWLCFAEVGRFRLAEGVFSWMVSMIIVGVVFGGMLYYSVQQISPRFRAAFNPRAEIVETFAPPFGG